LLYYCQQNYRLNIKIINLGRHILQILLVVSIFFSLNSCEDEGYMTSSDAQLGFSTDTVMFDTIFTTIGSTTQHFKVYNPYNENVLISRIRVSGGDFSNFRLNINGEVTNEAYEVEVPANDSIFIFVEVTIDPNGQNLPMVVQDSIEFTTNANLKNIKLVAYGQDFKLIKGQNIKTTTWTSEKPYLVYGYAQVDSSATLTIEPGTRIYFHKRAGLFVKGNIIAEGSYESPIMFLSDRLEDSYKNIPDQWDGVILVSGSHDNIFNYVTIKNANIGLQAGTIEHEGYASLELNNSRIENMAYSGLFALKSKISGYNNLIANCGFYAVALLAGGEYEFYHTTIANFWGNYSSRSRSTPSVIISNFLPVKKSDGTTVTYAGDLEKAFFGNSIIFGSNEKEIELGNNEENVFNYYFDHCIVQVPDSVDLSDKNYYKNVWKGVDHNPKFVDPFDDYDYSLDTLSAAKDIGNIVFAKMFQRDIMNKSRLADDGPDLGAFERIEKKDED
jgi:hypothetical protein